MDAPGLDERLHHHALDSLGRAAVVSRVASTLWPAVRSAATAQDCRPLRILDLACGGGHLAVALARRCVRAGIAAEITGWDVNPAALQYARAHLARASMPGVEFLQNNALKDTPPAGVDVVVCSLFLHHLNDQQAVELLRQMKEWAQSLVLVSDLRRTNLGYAFARVGCRLLSRSQVFRVDGPRSVRAAFTTVEVRSLVDRAGLVGASVIERWPQRVCVQWWRGGQR
jgi:2-polyprenyl-3-methyl-5-hydroxy-6-metoxy-1,4-benzoquinol methylase